MDRVRAALTLLVLLTAIPPLAVATCLSWPSWTSGRGSPVDLLAPLHFGWVAAATVPSVVLITLLAQKQMLRPLLGGISILAGVCFVISLFTYALMGGGGYLAMLPVLAFFTGLATILPTYFACYLLRRLLGLTPILGK